MNIGAGEMLRRLGSGVRPDGAAASPAPTPLEAQGFAGLLAAVKKGAVGSGRGLEIVPGAKVALSSEQLDRLAAVTDAAEAAGSSRLLALIDGQQVTIDVPERRITGGGAGPGGVLTDIDSVVVVPEGSAAEVRRLLAGAITPRGGRSRAGLPGPGTVRNDSIAGLLASLRKDPADAEPESGIGGKA